MILVPRDHEFGDKLITTCKSFVHDHLQPMILAHGLPLTDSAKLVAAASVLRQQLQTAVEAVAKGRSGTPQDSPVVSGDIAAASAAHSAALIPTANYDSEGISDVASGSSSGSEDEDEKD